MNVFDYMIRNRGEVLELTLQHLGMVTVAMALAVLIGIPLGILLTRRRGMSQWVLGAANVIQTVPSLALFGFLIPVPLLGVGPRTAIVALTLYALLPVIRNTYVGISQVDPAVVEAARGMGMTGGQMLWLVQVPLSLPVILAGIRVATVIAIGTATIAAAIGAGGLGEYIYRGVAGPKNYLLLAGAIPAALMAVVADASLGWAEQRLRSR
ncbi:MAG TPA: ABC transporter permease [Candidatus Acidoferrales bacterium]|nr:ABC transporter permease [Candidatus Acidoferrales bacterium]